MPRRPYHSVSAEDRQRTVGCSIGGLDYVACAYRESGDVQPRAAGPGAAAGLRS